MQSYLSKPEPSSKLSSQNALRYAVPVFYSHCLPSIFLCQPSPGGSWSLQCRQLCQVRTRAINFRVLTLLRAITGSAAQHPLATRQADCSAFMSPFPTPTVPAYASACGGSVRYSSACACLGYTAAPTNTCLSQTQATSIVNTFASLLTAPQAPDFASKAKALLADSFTDTSGSINFMARQNVSIDHES